MWKLLYLGGTTALNHTFWQVGKGEMTLFAEDDHQIK